MIPRPSPTHSPVGRLPVSPELAQPASGAGPQGAVANKRRGDIGGRGCQEGVCAHEPGPLGGARGRRAQERAQKQGTGAGGALGHAHPGPPPSPSPPTRAPRLWVPHLHAAWARVCMRARAGGDGPKRGEGRGRGGPAPRRRRGGGGGARAGPRPSVRTPVAPPSPPPAPAGNKGERAGSQGLDAPAHQSPSLSL